MTLENPIQGPDKLGDATTSRRSSSEKVKKGHEAGHEFVQPKESTPVDEEIHAIHDATFVKGSPSASPHPLHRYTLDSSLGSDLHGLSPLGEHTDPGFGGSTRGSISPPEDDDDLSIEIPSFGSPEIRHTPSTPSTSASLDDLRDRLLNAFESSPLKDHPESRGVVSSLATKVRDCQTRAQSHTPEVQDQLQHELVLFTEYFKSTSCAASILTPFEPVTRAGTPRDETAPSRMEKAPLTPFAAGKAKELFDFPGDETAVKVKAVSDPFFNAKEREITAEVAVMQEIKTNLSVKRLSEFIANLSVNPPINKDTAYEIAERIITKYGNIENLINECKTFPSPFTFSSELKLYAELGVPVDDVAALLAALRNDETTHSLQRIGSTLLLNMELLPKEHWIDDKPTWKMPRASGGDLEDLMATLKGEPFSVVLGYCRDIIHSLVELQASGHTHGDLKSDNFLIFEDKETGKKHAVLADFGKAKSQGPGETGLYTGNPRHISPEGKQSQAADCYALAILLIAMLERRYLDESGKLLPVALDDLVGTSQRAKQTTTTPEGKTIKGRDGIIEYLINNKHCPQSESSLAGRARSFVGSVIPLFRKDPEGILHAYINTLMQKYKDDPECPSKQSIEVLGKLLEGMTMSKPSERMDIAIVSETFDRNFPENLFNP